MLNLYNITVFLVDNLIVSYPKTTVKTGSSDHEALVGQDNMQLSSFCQDLKTSLPAVECRERALDTSALMRHWRADISLWTAGATALIFGRRGRSLA